MQWAKHFVLRMFLRTPRGQRWLNNTTGPGSLVGAHINEEKLWHWFKHALRSVAGNLKPIKVAKQLRYRFSHALEWVGHRIKGQPLSALPLQVAIKRLGARTAIPIKPGKKFLIALTEMPLSVEAADRCIESAKQYNEHHNLEVISAVDKHRAKDFFICHGLTYSLILGAHDTLSLMGCFSSHFKLWLHCMELGEPIIILEHDAVFRAAIPPLKFKHVIMLGHPHYPQEHEYINQLKPGSGREIFHPWPHLLGTHAYAITPEGAHKLVETARRQLLPPVDVFICKQYVDILYYHPAPISLDDRFSSIVKNFERGPGHKEVWKSSG